MSKLPHNSLWARATTTAPTPSRASSVLTKQAVHHYYSSSVQRPSATHSPATQVDVVVNMAGAVSAPFYGPQPAGVTEAWEQPGSESAPLYLVNTVSLAASFQSTFLLSAPMRRNMTNNFTIGSGTSRSLRPLHLWTQMSSVSDNSLPPRLPSRGRASGTKLLYDGDSNSGNYVPTTSSTDGVGCSNWHSREDAVALLNTSTQEASGSYHQTTTWLSQSGPSSTPAYILDGPGSTFAKVSNAPSPSRTPSPKRAGSHDHVDRGLQFGYVRERPAKFAITTTADASLSYTPTSGGSGSASSSSVATSSHAATPSAALSSSIPPSYEHSDAGVNGDWAKTFNIPRSSKRHDFMFEHGAYGIPKRHPLSSIRSSKNGSSRSKGKEMSESERRSPSHEVTPTSKVQAAADMLSAAAGFLAGSPAGGTAGEHRPMKGEEALSMAFSGGSTAEGHEVQPYSAYGTRTGTEKSGGRASLQFHTSPSKVAIRGEDGRIIKDRLRSVQVGEDSYFLRPDSLGVADGVGGWASRPGADPALFSRLLMHFCAVELSRYDNLSATDLAADNGTLLKSWAAVDPVEVMHKAWERCVRASRREGILGSSTALIALLRGDELRIANMGDCVLMIIRGGEMLFRSTEQQHSFNFPVQLGMMGDTAETMRSRTEAANKARAAGEGEVKSSEPLEDYDDVEDSPVTNKSGANGTFEQMVDGTSGGAGSLESGPDWDEPRRDAGRWTVRVQADDIIVVGSDGLMDNLFDEDIIEEVVRFLPPVPKDEQSVGAEERQSRGVILSKFSPQLVSEALCSRAKAVSEDSRAISSPFQQRAMEEGLHYVGGKHDDISVLVCLVGEREGIDASGVTSAHAADGKDEGGKEKFFVQ